MLAWQPDTVPHGAARPHDEARAPVRRGLVSFLIESEQRVIAHCHAMLARELTTDERRRLQDVLAQAELRLRRHAAAVA